MAHFERTQPDATWVAGYDVAREDFEDLDAKQFRSVNGDRGGAWAPEDPISLDGSGDVLEVTGPTEIARYGTLLTRVRVMGGSWPKFGATHPLRSRRIATSPLARLATPRFLWVTRHDAPIGVQSYALGMKTEDGEAMTPSCVVPLRVHDGATLSSVTFKFRVPAGRKATPQAMPKFRVFRIDQDGHSEDLKSTVLADGLDGPEPATSAAEWYASGAAQSFTYVCDRNNVIDRDVYAYFAEIREEASDEEGWFVERKPDVNYTASGDIALSGGMTIDGFVVADGDRVLVREQAIAAENGIYIVNTGGAWSRASDLASEGHFTRGFIVGVTSGNQNAGRFFKCTSPTSVLNFTLGTSAITFALASDSTPVGNIYTSILCDFTGIADMRWQ